MTTQLNNLFDYCKENERVCPIPMKWNELWKMLPGRSRQGNGWEPPLPLILAAWWETTNMSKSNRLREHLEWADQQNALDPVDNFLRSLPESDWHHAKD